ncbi:response regulator transcription factor [Gorillibacterium sp. sgz5001074]|uniref:response regulator transcription factor n=1 Tax=Gorillibacterium sp. sgz5001074 TaxID=3446695 RepID=UPI003F66BE43
MADRILIIEDEQRIARVLELELRHEGYGVEWAEEGGEGLALALQGDWSCILLDLQLPGKDGFELLAELREQNPRVPVLVMTARDALSDKVKGLDLGANDYITKPFDYEELSARIRAMLRTARTAASADEGEISLTFDGLTADLKSRTVTRDDNPIELTPREFDLLIHLLRHPGIPLSRERLLSEVWGFDFAGETNLVDVYIRYLRQKIDKGAKKKLIHTVRGIGYCLRGAEEA